MAKRIKAGWWGSNPLDGDSPQDLLHSLEGQAPQYAAKLVAKELLSSYDDDIYGAMGVWDWVMTHGPEEFKREFTRLSRSIAQAGHGLLVDEEFLDSWTTSEDTGIAHSFVQTYSTGKPTGKIKKNDAEVTLATAQNKSTRKATMSRIKIGKKKEAQERQPGQIGDKLRRRMGDAHAEVFNDVGSNLYNSIVLTIKNDLESLFEENIGTLEETIREELGKRGLVQAAEYFAPWILEVLEDVIQFGMKDVAGKLEELGNSAASEFIKESEEEVGEEDLFDVEETEPIEEIEEVTEEPVEAPPEEEELAPEEAVPEGLEELMAPEEEGEAAAGYSGAPKQRVWRRKQDSFKRTASFKKERRALTIEDLVKSSGGEDKLRSAAGSVNEAFNLLNTVQQRLVAKLTERFSEVEEANPHNLLDWAMKRFPVQ